MKPQISACIIWLTYNPLSTVWSLHLRPLYPHSTSILYSPCPSVFPFVRISSQLFRYLMEGLNPKFGLWHYMHVTHVVRIFFYTTQNGEVSCEFLLKVFCPSPTVYRWYITWKRIYEMLLKFRTIVNNRNNQVKFIFSQFKI